MIQLPHRKQGYTVLAKTNIDLDNVRKLAETTECVWKAILDRDDEAWEQGNKQRIFEALIEMFPECCQL